MKRNIITLALLLPAILFAAAPPTKDILLGQFRPSQNPHFVRIDPRHTDKTDIYLQHETYQAYTAMYDAALRDGITLTIVSATRTFSAQLAIWNRKWARLTTPDTTRIRTIMRYSSMPGTSRHHWGTDIDFISVETNYWTHGYGLKAYRWLQANAHKYGFYQPYTDHPARTGYAEERWHWSYYPISDTYTHTYTITITPADITGFPGADLVDTLHIIRTHVLGIDTHPSPRTHPTTLSPTPTTP